MEETVVAEAVAGVAEEAAGEDEDATVGDTMVVDEVAEDEDRPHCSSPAAILPRARIVVMVTTVISSTLSSFTP